MRPEDETLIRNAALDLALNTDTSRLTCANVAERAGVPLEAVQEFCRSDEALIGFMLSPLTADLDNRLRLMPIHSSPTIDQRHDVLDAVLDAGLEHPAQVALIVRIRTNPHMSIDHRRADRFSYQAGVRLLGTEYDSDPDVMTRVNLITDLLCLTIANQRVDFADKRQRNVILDSALAALSPAPRPPDPSGHPDRRRWTDPGTQSDPQT